MIKYIVILCFCLHQEGYGGDLNAFLFSVCGCCSYFQSPSDMSHSDQQTVNESVIVLSEEETEDLISAGTTPSVLNAPELTEERVDPRATILMTPSILRMGIEIETSAIKLQESKFQFLITTISDHKFYLETDTLDYYFQDSQNSIYNRNLEIKTIGGHQQESIGKISQEIQQILQEIKNDIENKNNLIINSKYLKNIKCIDEVKVKNENAFMKHMMAFGKDTIKSVRPQLTYQLPLSLMPWVFKRLAELEHPYIQKFLQCLNIDYEKRSIQMDQESEEKEDQDVEIHHTNTFNTEEYSLEDTLNTLFEAVNQKGFKRNQACEKCMQLIFYHELSPVLQNTTLKTTQGFLYLFFYYWNTLFNEKDKIMKNKEPGPKGKLAILLRVPFSQVFDALSFTEQCEIKNILNPLMERFPDDIFRLISYDLFENPGKYDPDLTLKQWYVSIVETSKRKNINKKFVDLLSPPPGLENTEYSMGFFDISDSDGFPLIEVRGYANLKLGENKSVLSIDEISNFILKESDCFFNSINTAEE